MTSRILTLLLLLASFNLIAAWTITAPKAQVPLQAENITYTHLNITSEKLATVSTRKLGEEIQRLRADYEGYVKRYDRSMNLVVKKVKGVMEKMGTDGMRGDGIRDVKHVVDGMVVKMGKDGVKENLALRLEVMRLLNLVDTVTDEVGIIKGYMVDVKEKLSKLGNLVSATE
jgi:hypothetical protein